MRRESPQGSDLGARIASQVIGEVSEQLGRRLEVRVAEVRDLRHEEGRLVFEMEDPGARMPDLTTDGKPVETQFDAEDAERLVQEFRRVKRNTRR
jgi:hypothetical protein